jgi:glycosyltransferase involved in cell wall biosynthesis
MVVVSGENHNLPVRWLVAQEGSRQSYAIPVAFHRLGALRLLYADIWCRWGRSWLKRGTTGARALAGRYNAEIPQNRVVSFSPGAMLAKMQEHFRRHHLSPAQLADDYCRFGRWLALRVRNHAARLELDPAQDCYFGFDTNCLETLELMRARGICTVVDQVDPGLVEEEIVLAEAERWPGWEKTPGRLPRSYWDRRAAEWAAADLVLVNSNWSRDALIQQNVPAHKIIVIPLAIDLAREHVLKPVQATGPLRVLWLGSVILRKGIQYLVEAARRLRTLPIEFLLAGPLRISAEALKTFPPNIKPLGRITRDQLGGIYSRAHVFVLPTISDGFAITQLEAMAHGLPVIATPNCGQVVTDGRDGFIVPARDSEALADAIARFHADRPMLRAMSANALLTVLKYDLPSNARMINDAVLEFRRKRSVAGASADVDGSSSITLDSSRFFPQ